MRVDETTVLRIARLARIKISKDEAKGLEKELTGILNWVEQLNSVDTASVEPMTRVVPIELKKRTDVISDGDIADDAAKNAPLVEDHDSVVPKVVEEHARDRTDEADHRGSARQAAQERDLGHRADAGVRRRDRRWQLPSQCVRAADAGAGAEAGRRER